MSEVLQKIDVGIAEARFSSSPNVLITRGLGSCLGVVIYEPYKKIGGLAHPMLPNFNEAKAKGSPLKFVDYVIPYMIEELKKQGCFTSSLVAKLFGGAHMFSSIPTGSFFDIGARNIDAARAKLDSCKIKIVGEDVGSNYGRTIFFDLDSCKTKVITLFYGEKDV